MLIAALVVALAVAIGWAVALLVAQRTAVARVTAASEALIPPASPAEREPAHSLDEALDDLEATVTASVAARRRTARGEDRLSWALGAIGHGVVVFDQRGEVAYRNDPAATFLAARHSDALVEEAINSLAADALRGRQGTRELELFGPPRRILNVKAVPLEDPARPSGALVIVEDTSERRHLENVRRDFVANISHELKTPVGALALLAETLLDETDPTVARRLASRLANEAFRVGRTIDDLLELSRLEAAAGGLRDDRVEVARFVGEAVERVRPGAEQRGIEIESGDIAAQPVRRGRAASARLGRGQPGRQRREVQRGRLDRVGPGPHRRRLGRRGGPRPGHRHPPARPRAHLRALLPGRPGAQPRDRRHRPGPRHRPPRGLQPPG